jgi:sugar-specific transcriptional regulator TrmB
MEQLPYILSSLGLSPAEQRVYRALLAGAGGAREVQSTTGMKRPTVYYALQQLEQLGLVAKHGSDKTWQYKLESAEKLNLLVTQKQQALTTLQVQTTAFIQSFSQSPTEVDVTVTHFETMASVTQAILFTLYCKDKCIRSIVPRDNFFERVGIDFKKEYVTEKLRRDVKTRAIWETVPEPAVINTYYSDIEMIPMPKPMCGSFSTTLFIYDTKVLYVYPSLKKPHAILIDAPDHAAITKAMFETVWHAN